jgi:hypothetical protein
MDDELLPVDDGFDPEVFLRTRTIEHVAAGIQGLLDAMRNGMNPIRVLRLIETLATTTRDQLAELGTPEPGARRRGGNDFGLGALGGGHAQETVIVEQAMSFMQDMGDQTRGEFHTRRVRNMTQALRNAKDMEDDDLAATLRTKLDGLLADDAAQIDVPNSGVLGVLADDDAAVEKPVLVPRAVAQAELPIGAPA